MVRRVKRLACKAHPTVTGARVAEHYSLHVCLLWNGMYEEDD